MTIFKTKYRIKKIKDENERLCRESIELHEAIDFYHNELEVYKKRNKYLERKNTELTKALKEKESENGTKKNV